MDFALGEVQNPGVVQTPWSRHAVIYESGMLNSWQKGMCSAEPFVWVPAVAGAFVPFPGPAASEGAACPECVALVGAAVRAADQRKEPSLFRRWLSKPPADQLDGPPHPPSG